MFVFIPKSNRKNTLEHLSTSVSRNITLNRKKVEVPHVQSTGEFINTMWQVPRVDYSLLLTNLKQCRMDEIGSFLNPQKEFKKTNQPDTGMLWYKSQITQGSQITGTGKVEGCMSGIVEVEEWGLMLQCGVSVGERRFWRCSSDIFTAVETCMSLKNRTTLKVPK